MSFSINPTHNFLEDTPVIIEEQPSNGENEANKVKANNNITTESKDDSNIIRKSVSSSNGGLQVQQIPGALDDFY